MNEIATMSAFELQKQNERIMKFDDEMMKLDAAGVRIMRHVRYFGKTYMTDRFIQIMVLLISLAIVGIVVSLLIPTGGD